MNGLSIYYTLVVRNIRYFQGLYFILAFLLCGCILSLFGTVNLSETATMQILGRFFPLLGLVLIPPIICHELQEEITDVIYTKQISHWKIILFRLASTCLMVVLLYVLYVSILTYNDSDILWKHVLYSCVNLWFLGSLGLLLIALTKNVTIGYMVAIIYYLMNFFVPKQLGAFYLFNMHEAKWMLLIATIGCLGASITWMARKK